MKPKIALTGLPAYLGAGIAGKNTVNQPKNEFNFPMQSISDFTVF